MESASDHPLAASVYALGLLHNFVRREEVVEWADRQIEALDVPPMWLIDLSMSQHLHYLDMIALLKPVAAGVNKLDTVTAAFSMLPCMGDVSFEDAIDFAYRLYCIAFEGLNVDWSQPLLRELDWLSDEFMLVRDGYSATSERDLIDRLQSFIEQQRNPKLSELFQPVAWVAGGGDGSVT